jgi:hypothetical protein
LENELGMKEALIKMFEVTAMLKKKSRINKIKPGELNL